MLVEPRYFAEEGKLITARVKRKRQGSQGIKISASTKSALFLRRLFSPERQS
jgi:hypothetical protein